MKQKQMNIFTPPFTGTELILICLTAVTITLLVFVGGLWCILK